MDRGKQEAERGCNDFRVERLQRTISVNVPPTSIPTEKVSIVDKSPQLYWRKDYIRLYVCCINLTQ